VAVSTTVHLPLFVYWWLAFLIVEYVPSPNDQFQFVGVLEDVSLNCTHPGNRMSVRLAVRLATGVTSEVTFTNVVCVDQLDPAELVAFRLNFQLPTSRTSDGF